MFLPHSCCSHSFRRRRAEELLVAILEKRCFFLRFADLERFSGVVTVGWGVQRWVEPIGHGWEGKLAQRQPLLFQVDSSEALGYLDN